MKGPTCSLIVVNHNGRRYLRSCFESLFLLTYPREQLDLILLDNASQDGSADHVKSAFPTVRTFLNVENNFAKAVNLGIVQATGQYIGLLNNDVIVEPGWLTELVRILEEQPTAGAAAGKLRLSERGGGRINSVCHRRLPDFFIADLGYGEEDHGQYDGVRTVPGLCWAAVLFRRECLQDVGPVDEDFVMYFEDVDYAARCRSRAWDLFYTHLAVAHHEFQGSSRGTNIPDFFCNRNRLLYVAKHVPLALPRAIASSHFYLRGDFDLLFECLPIVLKKLLMGHDAATIERVLPAVCELLIPIYGVEAVDHLLARLQVIVGHRKMSLGIYDYALHVIGGGQKYTCTMGSLLQDQFDVTFIANRPVGRLTLESWYQTDVSRCRFETVRLPFYEERQLYWIDPGRATEDVENPFEPVSIESGQYDVFIDANMNEKVLPLAPLSLFVCCFPERARDGHFAVDDYTLVIAISRYTSEWMKTRWGIEPDWLLYPAVAFEGPQTPKEEIILSVARFEPGGSKKQKELIEAFDRLLRANPDLRARWRLLLVGGSLPDNQYLQEVRALAAASDKRIEVKVNVATSEVQEAYAKASIFWHACGLDEGNPHLVEHFGMTTVEAMQNRCVPVVINGGGQREIVEQGRTGFLFDTIDELCQWTAQLIRRPELFRELQENAYQASRRFSRSRFEQQVHEAFDVIQREYSSIQLPDPAVVGRVRLDGTRPDGDGRVLG